MRFIKKISLLLFIPLLFNLALAQNDPCPKPKIIIMIQFSELALDKANKFFESQSEENWKSEIGKWAKEKIKSNSGDIDVDPGEVEFEKGKDSCTTAVKLTDCNGLPVQSRFRQHKVFLTRRHPEEKWIRGYRVATALSKPIPGQRPNIL